MKKLIKSILSDCKSLDRIIINRWHLHAPIAFIIGYFIRKVLSYTFDGVDIWFTLFCPMFLGFLVLFGFECWQQRGRMIGELERFESDKDLWVGEIFLICGVILNFIAQ